MRYPNSYHYCYLCKSRSYGTLIIKEKIGGEITVKFEHELTYPYGRQTRVHSVNLIQPRAVEA